jgi:hypothetical protein
MIAFGDYAYDDDKATLTCKQASVLAPVLALSHDEDGDLNFTCGADSHSERHWLVIGLGVRVVGLRAFSLSAENVRPCFPGTIF